MIKKAVRFDLNPPTLQHISHRLAHPEKSRQIECDLLSLPLYMVEQLPRIFQKGN